MSETVIYLTDEDREILNHRYCENCGYHLKRPKNCGLEQWINTKFCNHNCAMEHRKDLGLVFHNKEYKCRSFTKTAYGLTVPKWFMNKYRLKDTYFKFEFTNGKFIIYTSTKKCKGSMKLRSSGFKDYMQIGIPLKYVKKYNLVGKLFKFEDKGKDCLFYTILD